MRATQCMPECDRREFNDASVFILAPGFELQ
jgi:hypothetical protein